MNYLTQFKRYLYGKQLEKVVGSQKNRVSTSIDKSKHIGILFDATLTASDPVLAYAKKLEKKGIRVDILAFAKRPKEETVDLPYPFYHVKQIGFNYIPKGEVVQQFIQQPFDILICFFQSENLGLEYISASSMAKCRIGNQLNKTYCFDLMINAEKKVNDFKYYIQQVEQILAKMNCETYERTTI